MRLLVNILFDRRSSLDKATNFLTRLSPNLFSHKINSDASILISLPDDSVSFLLYEDTMYSKARKLLSRPAHSKITNISILNSINSGEACTLPAPLSLVDMLRTSEASTIKLENRLTEPITEQITQAGESRLNYVKELCVPCTHLTRPALHAQLTNHNAYILHDSLPGVYRPTTGKGANIRLFPAQKLGVTLRLDPVLIENILESADTEKMGSQLEYSYLIPSSFPLSLRVTDALASQCFYSEGSEAVLDGTIDALQSKRVLLGDEKHDDSALVDPRINNGNCWLEVREIGKKPLQVFSSELRRPSMQQQPSPSLHE